MFLRALFLHNFWWKLFSVVLATLIWLAVSDQRVASAEVTREFPHRPVLVMTGTGEHPALAIEPPEVSVLVRGPIALIGELNDQDIQVFLNLQGRTDVAGDFGLVVRAPPGVSEAVVFPKKVTLRPLARP
jgi:hypothetical protein